MPAYYGDCGVTLRGKKLAPGMGCGPAFVHRPSLASYGEFYPVETSDVEGEWARLDQVAEQILRELRALAARTKKRNGSTFSDVFRTHMEMIQDAGMRSEIKKEIETGRISAGAAVQRVFGRWERRFNAMQDDCLRAKAADIRDIARRFVRTLAGADDHALARMPNGSVLIAPRLLPSDIPFLVNRAAAAVVVETGGTASHAALFARESGLPCVGGVAGATEAADSGVATLVDADQGKVVLAPSTRIRFEFENNRKRRGGGAAKASDRARRVVVRSDGKRILALANVGRQEDVQRAVDNGADGIGLYRIEHIYMGRRKIPDASELFEAMRETLLPAKGLPVHVRLLDAGADKPIPFLPPSSERNPALGSRGVRLLLQQPEILHPQLDALLALSEIFRLCVVVPMVSLASDVRSVRKHMLDRAALKKTKRMPALGAMIETPAAALSAADIARDAEWLSFGTNDLTQYAFAVDRDNPRLERYFDDTHKAIFQLLLMACKAARGRPLSVCGELAGRTECVAQLLACGIESLSVAPGNVPACKEAMRRAVKDARAEA